MNDFKILDVIPIEKGGYYVMDKGYTDFEGLYRIKDEKLISTRLDTRIAYKDAGIICDQDIQLISIYSNQHYPVPLRSARYYEAIFDRPLVGISNKQLQGWRLSFIIQIWIAIALYAWPFVKLPCNESPFVRRYPTVDE